MNVRKFSIILITSFMLWSCTTLDTKNWDTHQGQVIDAKTKNSLEQVNVIAVWKGLYTKNGVTTTTCYHAEILDTDNNGNFQVPAWQESTDFAAVYDKSLSVVLYKVGYWSKNTSHALNQNSPTVIYMEPVSTNNRQNRSKYRLKYLQKIVSLTSCELWGEGKNKLLAVFQQIVAEAESVAKTSKDDKVVESIKKWTQFVED